MTTSHQYPPMSGWHMAGRRPAWRVASQYQRDPYLIIISDGYAYVETRHSSLGLLAASGPVPPYTVQGDVPLACVAAAEWLLEEYRHRLSARQTVDAALADE